MNDNPFGSSTRTGRRRLKVAGFLIATAVAVLAVLRWSGQGGSSSTSAHDMSTMGQAGDQAGPVTLTPTARQRIGVTYAAAAIGPVVRTVRVVGLVKEDETRTRSVTARVDGFVESLDADFAGELVHAGQTLLELYSPEVLTAENELLLALELARSISPADSEARASASRATDAARRRLRLWNVPEEVVTRVERSGSPERVFPLRSEWDGFVVEKRVLLGQRVMAGELLYRLADLGVVWVEGEVFEQDLPLVRIGVAVMLTFQALPGVERMGHVTYVYPTVDPNTRTARVRVELTNPGYTLKPGMYGSLKFDGQLANGLSVPRSAVVATGTRNLVFVKLPDGRFEPREVVVGAATPELVQVLRGLALGDTVVASGTFLMDAESNLGSLLGGMGDMPGMDLSPPKAASGKAPPPPADHRHGGR